MINKIVKILCCISLNFDMSRSEINVSLNYDFLNTKLTTIEGNNHSTNFKYRSNNYIT